MLFAALKLVAGVPAESNRVLSIPLTALPVAGLSMQCRFKVEAVESRFIELEKPVWNQTWMSSFGHPD